MLGRPFLYENPNKSSLFSCPIVEFQKPCLCIMMSLGFFDYECLRRRHYIEELAIKSQLKSSNNVNKGEQSSNFLNSNLPRQ